MAGVFLDGACENIKPDADSTRDIGTDTVRFANIYCDSLHTAGGGGGSGVGAGTYNVKDYGALGDGVTDDTTAFQNATNAAEAAGGSVLVPATSSSYVLTTVAIKSPIIGDGYGSYLEMSGEFDIDQPYHNLLIRGLRFGFTADDALLSINGTDGGVTLERVRVEGCWFDFGGSVTTWLAINTQYSNDVQIHNCFFAKGGIQLIEAANYVISHNYFDGESTNDKELVHASKNSSGVIDGNTFRNSQTDVIDLFSNGDRCVVTNNRIFDTEFGSGKAGTVIELKTILRDADPGQASNQYGYIEGTLVANNIIQGMTVDANGRYAAINYSYTDSRAATSFDLDKTARHNAISGNIIEEWDSNHDPGLNSIYFAGIKAQGINTTISGNSILNINDGGENNWQTCGIELGYKYTSPAITASATGFVVTGNNISTDSSGIVVDSADKCTISDNVIREDDSRSLTPINGIYIVTEISDCIVSGNVIHADTSSGYGLLALSATTTSVQRCQFIGNSIQAAGNNLRAAEYCTFSDNICRGSVTFGTNGTERLGNKLLGNTFYMPSTAYCIVLDDQKGLIASDNTFYQGTWAILLQNDSTYCSFTGNVSHDQTQPTVVRYLSVTAADQATCIDHNNIVVDGLVHGGGTISTADVTNPPTDAELDSEFGTPATVGAGFLAVVDDNGAGTNLYQCISDGTNWWTFAGTKAT